MSAAPSKVSVPVRPLAESDREAAAGVIAAAFGDGGTAVVDLWADVLSRGHVRAELVALDDEQVIGHVGLSHAWLDTRPELVDILVLSPLGVAPDHQRRGAGKALLAAAVKEAARLGAPLVALEGDPGYYSRHGWHPASSYGIEPPSLRVPRPACQVVPLAGHKPWMTGRIVYRDVWWEHDSAGLRDPLLAQVEMNLPD